MGSSIIRIVRSAQRCSLSHQVLRSTAYQLTQHSPLNTLVDHWTWHNNRVLTNFYLKRSFHFGRRGKKKRNASVLEDTSNKTSNDLNGSLEEDEKRTNGYFRLQMIYRDNSMTVNVKSKKLKDTLLELIPSLLNEQFSKDQLPFINEVVNFIDHGESPTEFFTAQEMMSILKSILPAMTIDDVKYLNFFPRFYMSLRETSEYQRSKFMRLQLFEIFLNYVLLNKNRQGLIRIIDAFLNEESELRGQDVRKEVVNIVLEAFKAVGPDTATTVHLAEVADISEDKELVTRILEDFFVAADDEISEDYERNEVEEHIMQLLNILEKRLDCPLMEYINLLYFASRDDFDRCCLEIMQKVSTLTKTFTDELLLDNIRNDELMAIVSSALKFHDYNKGATKLIGHLQSKRKPEEFSKGEWIAYLQYKIYKIPSISGAEAVPDLIKMIDQINNDLIQKYHKKFQFNDTDSYNYFLEALCYSNKPTKFIETFFKEFADDYDLSKDARSFAIIIEHFLNEGDIKEALDLFEKSLSEAILWDSDYSGMYMPVLFRLLADYFNKTNDDLYYKAQLYKKIKTFEIPIDRKALYAMASQFLKSNFVGDAIKAFEKEVPSLNGKETKYQIEDYSDLFELYYRYATSNCENLKSNWLLYEFLSKFFRLPYEFYPAFLKFWIDVGFPSRSLKIYADMKLLSKENKLQPPDENIYLYLLQSFSKSQYEDGIFKLQLAIKMDLSLNIDIRLLNMLMGAFCSIEDSFRVRDVFNLAQSLPKKRGVNQESCYWALKSLKFVSLNEVNNFYTSLSQFDVCPDANLFGEYLISHCYFEQYGTAYDKLIDTYENGDLELIDRNVLKNFHNFCLNEHVRKKLNVFATRRFPEIWSDLKAKGELSDDTTKQPSLLDNPYEKIHLQIK